MAIRRFLLSSRMGGSATAAVGGGLGFAGPRASRLRHRGERALKILYEDPVVSCQDVASAYHDYIHIDLSMGGTRRLHRRPEAALDPVPLGRMTDLFGDREADPQSEPVLSS